MTFPEAAKNKHEDVQKSTHTKQKGFQMSGRKLDPQKFFFFFEKIKLVSPQRSRHCDDARFFFFVNQTESPRHFCFEGQNFEKSPRSKILGSEVMLRVGKDVSVHPTRLAKRVFQTFENPFVVYVCVCLCFDQNKLKLEKVKNGISF